MQLGLQRLRQPGWGCSEGAWGCSDCGSEAGASPPRRVVAASLSVPASILTGILTRRRRSVIVSSRHPSPPLSSPATCEGTLQVVAVWSSRRRRCKTIFSKYHYEFTCHVFHPKSTALFTPPFTASHRARLVVAVPSPPCCRARVIDADVVIASTWPPSSPCRRAVVPASSCPRRRLRAIVPAPSSPRLSSILTPILTSILTPCRRPSSSSRRYPHPVLASSSLRCRRHVVAAQSSRRRCRFVGSVSTSRRHVVASSFLPVVAASSPRRRPCLSLPRPRVVVVVPASCRVAPASSPPSILTFILTTSVLTLSSPRRRLASSSPSSLRCRRVAVELSCHSAVVAAAFPASSPPRRLVSVPSSFHLAVIGPSRRSSVRLGAPSSSPRRSLVHPGAPSWSFQSSPPFGAGAPPSSPKSSSPPFGDGAAQCSTVIAAAVIAP